MRRLIIVEPIVGAALWCRRFALLGLVLVLLAVTTSRAGVLQPLAALGTLAAGLAFAALALAAALAAAVAIWRTGRPGIPRILVGSLVALLLLAYPAWLALGAADQPGLFDIATDWANPPQFSQTVRAVAARHGAVHPVPTETARRRQAEAYPDIKPTNVDLAADETYKLALKLVAARHWRLVESQSPGPRLVSGHIDAVARSMVMGLPQDVTIRIAAIGAGQARVDMRSASRFAHADLGANAARISAFLSDLETAVDDQ